MSRSARVARNVSWSVAGQGIIAISNLFLIPVLIRGFGVEDYGLYILMFTAANYIPLFTLGAGTATIKFIAEHTGAKDEKAVADTLRHSAALHFGGALIGSALLWIFAPWAVTKFFQIPARLEVPGIAILRAAAAGAVFASGAQWAQASLAGFQRFDLHSLTSLGQGLLLPMGVAILLGFGKGLKAAGIWYVLVNLMTFLSTYYILRRVRDKADKSYTGQGISFFNFTSYGVGMWFGPMFWVFSSQLDKIFIARSMALAQLTLYSVPLSILQRLQLLPASVSSVLVPVMSEVQGSDAHADLRHMYIRATRLLTGLLAVAYGLMFALMPQFLTLWLGGRFGMEGVWPARLLVLANWIGVLVFTAHSIVIGRHRGWWQSALSFGQALIGLLAWPYLIPHFGIIGAATGSLLAQAIPTLFYLHAVHRLIHLTWRQYLTEALGPATLATIAIGLVIFPIHGYIGRWISLISLSVAGGCIYAAVIWPFLSNQDRDLIRAWCRWPIKRKSV